MPHAPLPRLAPLRRLAVLALLALAACSVGGPIAPPQPLAPARLTQSEVEGLGGTKLALSAWPARGRAAPRAVILAVHGYGDFGPSTFAMAARFWAAQGITTYAYDQRGFGRNDSFRQWPGAPVLVADLRTVAAAVRARHPEAPLVVAGHSMGGGVALAAAGQGLAADGLVLGAPAIAGGAGVGPLRRLGAWAIGAAAPDRRFTGDGLVEFRPTDNAAVRRAVTAHPRHFADPSGRELAGLLEVMDRAAAAAPRVSLPTLTLMGARDEILSPAAVRRVHARIPGGTDFRLYPQGWHWVFRDRQAPRVWADVAGFALSLPPPGVRPGSAPR